MFSGSNLRALEWSRLGLASGKPFCGFHEFHKKDTKLQSCKWCTDFAPRHCGSTWRPARGLFQTRLDGDEGFELTKWANFITKKQNHKKTKAFLCQLANHINTQSLNRLNPNFNSIRCRRHHRRPNHPACLVVLAVLAIQEAKDLCSVHCCGSLFTQFSSAFDGVKCQTNKRFFLGLRFAYNVGTSEIISIHFFPTRLWRKDLHLDFGTKLNWQRMPWPSKFVDTKHPHMPTDVTLEVALYPLAQRSRRVNSPALPWFEMHGFMKFLSLGTWNHLPTFRSEVPLTQRTTHLPHQLIGFFFAVQVAHGQALQQRSQSNTFFKPTWKMQNENQNIEFTEWLKWVGLHAERLSMFRMLLEDGISCLCSSKFWESPATKTECGLKGFRENWKKITDLWRTSCGCWIDNSSCNEESNCHVYEQRIRRWVRPFLYCLVS